MAKRKKVIAPLKASQKSTLDLAGSGAKYAAVDEMKRLLDGLRRECFSRSSTPKLLDEAFGVDKGKIKPFTEEDRGENP
jgi:hypothetical protein